MADFNNDGKNDLLTFVGIGNEWGHPKYYQVSVSINSDGILSEPIPVLKIPHNLERLENVDCVDMNGDNNVDLVYKVDIGHEWGHPKYYQIMVAYGRGDGTFMSPKVLQKILSKDCKN